MNMVLNVTVSFLWVYLFELRVNVAVNKLCCVVTVPARDGEKRCPFIVQSHCCITLQTHWHDTITSYIILTSVSPVLVLTISENQVKKKKKKKSMDSTTFKKILVDPAGDQTHNCPIGRKTYHLSHSVWSLMCMMTESIVFTLHIWTDRQTGPSKQCRPR